MRWSTPADRRMPLALRAVVAAAAAVGTYLLLASPLVVVEGDLMALAGSVMSGRVDPAGGGAAFVTPPDGVSVGLVLARTCTSAAAIAALVALALLVVRGGLRQRLVALVAAVSVVVVVNAVRLAGLSLVLGHLGAGAFFFSHDWAGSATTLVGAAIGVGVYLRLALAGRRVSGRHLRQPAGA